jgi:hypothetical protein
MVSTCNEILFSLKRNEKYLHMPYMDESQTFMAISHCLKPAALFPSPTDFSSFEVHIHAISSKSPFLGSQFKLGHPIIFHFLRNMLFFIEAQNATFT